MYSDNSAQVINTVAANTVKAYKDTCLKGCRISDYVTIGDRSRITNSELHEHVIIQRGNLITDSTLGRYTSTMHNTSIFKAQIGAFCAISWSVSIGGASHGYENATIHGFISCHDFGIIEREKTGFDLYESPVIIGNDVWIATGVCINRGVTIGDGAVIGANAVVTEDVEPYTIVVGCPARPIKKRFSDDFIMRLQKSKWWDLSEKKLKENVELFSGKLDEHRLAEIEKICEGVSFEVYNYWCIKRDWQEMCGKAA